MPGFLKLLWFVRRYVCLSVCLPAPEVINNQWHDIGCDIGCMRLGKQVSRLFPAFYAT